MFSVPIDTIIYPYVTRDGRWRGMSYDDRIFRTTGYTFQPVFLIRLKAPKGATVPYQIQSAFSFRVTKIIKNSSFYFRLRDGEIVLHARDTVARQSYIIPNVINEPSRKDAATREIDYLVSLEEITAETIKDYRKRSHTQAAYDRIVANSKRLLFGFVPYEYEGIDLQI